MKSVHDLETPAVLIDLDRLERNISGMAARAREAGVALRPHAKTHKVPEIGRMQLRAGAVGLSVAKTSEAEVFARHGFDDLFVAYPAVGPTKAARLAELAKKIRLRVGIDSVEGAAMLGEAAVRAGITISVSLKIDVGYHRVGVDPSVAVSFGTRVAEIRGVKLDAIFTHAGQAYNRGTTAEIEKDTIDEAAIMAGVAEDMRQEGLSIECVSVGSTPTAKFGFARPGLTEARPGNYVYLDRTQVGLGTCTFDECAMTVLATVVSHPVGDRMTLDAGSKTLSSDILRPAPDGHGLIAGSESRLVKLSEEHGVVAIAAGETYSIGDRVRVYPNHACVVSNLHNRVYGVRGETVETEFEVAARGCVE